MMVGLEIFTFVTLSNTAGFGRGLRKTGMWNKHPGDDAEGAGICCS